LAKLENPLQRNPSEFLHTLLGRGHEEEVPAYREVLSWVGLTLLVLGMAFIHTGDPYPGWRAILPVAGTLLLMEGGAGGLKGAWVNRMILSNPAVVWIGLISYPLYLFHWPALSFVHIVKGDSPKPVYLVDALIVALILTVLTYYFIERKLRHNKSNSTIPLLLVAFLLIGVFGLAISQKNIPSRPLSASVYKMFLSVRDKDMMHGILWFSPGKYSVSFNRAGGNGPQTIFLGDSNMQQYGSRISKLLAANTGESRGAILVTTGGVLPIKGVTDQKGKSSDDLLAKFQEVVSSEPRIDRVVIAARWVAYFTDGGRFRLNGVSLGEKGAQVKAFQELGQSIRELVAKGKKVIVVKNIPTGAELDPKKIYPRTFTGSYRQEKKVLSKEKFLSDHGEILSSLAKTACENGAEVIDPMDYLCTNGICIAEDENGPIRYDEGHLRPGYVREHVKYLDQTVGP